MIGSVRGRGRPPKRGRVFRNERYKRRFYNRRSVCGDHQGKNADEDPLMTLETDTGHLPFSLTLTALDCNETITESIGETLNCKGNHSELQLKEEDLNTPLEKDPLDLTEDERPIKSEIEDIFISNEMTSNEAIESSNDPCFPDKNEDEDPATALEADRSHIPSNLYLTESDCIETIPVNIGEYDGCNLRHVHVHISNSTLGMCLALLLMSLLGI